MPKISVIVPVYGVEKYIAKCIDSILNQTFKDFEIIVVDDGTKDKSIDIINQQFNDKRIEIYHKKNGGLASARNFGLEKATGDYLLFIDSDDFVNKDMFMNLYNESVNNNLDIVMCDYYKYYNDTNKEVIPLIPNFDDKNIKCYVNAMPTSSCKLFKRDLFYKNNLVFPEGLLFEDNAVIPYVCALTRNISYIKQPYYYYLQRDGSYLNRQEYNKKWEDIFESLEVLYNHFVDGNKYDEYHDELEYIFIEYLIHAAGLKFLKYKEGVTNLEKIHDVMTEKFSNWNKNKYFKQMPLKYRIVCNLIFKSRIKLLKMILRSN